MDLPPEFQTGFDFRLRRSGTTMAQQLCARAVLTVIARNLAGMEGGLIIAALEWRTGLDRGEMRRTLELLERLGAIRCTWNVPLESVSLTAEARRIPPHSGPLQL